MSEQGFQDLRLLRIDAAAERYYCSRSTIERACRAGHITSYQPGLCRLIDLDTADQWFIERTIKSKRTASGSDKPRANTVGRPRKR